MNIPPLRSRTPPPFCDCDNENDADYGAFTMCSNFGGESYDDFQTVEKTVVVEDSASEDSGLCTGSSIGQAHSPYETSPTTVLKTIPNGDTNIFESLPITDSIQNNKSSDHSNIDASDVILHEDGVEEPIEIEDVKPINDDYTELKSHDFNNVDAPPSSSYSIVESTSKTTNQEFDYDYPEFVEEETVDFEDFQVFQPIEEDASLPVPCEVDPSNYSYSRTDSLEKLPTEKEESLNDDNWDQNEEEDKDLDDDFDDFCDFQTSSSVPPPSDQTAPDQIPTLSVKEDQFNPEFFQAEPELSGPSENVTDPSTNYLIPTLNNLVCQNNLWLQIRSLEDTPALRFQWNSSSSNRKLLMALKIDARNILCNLWAKSAKSGGQENIALNPIKIGSDPKDLPKNQSSSIPKNIVPDAHFDWDGSGLTNPLDCGNTALLDLPHLSFTCASNSILTETAFHTPSSMSTINELNLGSAGSVKNSQQAEEILSLLPDRSYMKKTYIVFKRNPQM